MLGVDPLGVEPLAVIPAGQSGISGTTIFRFGSEDYASLPTDQEPNLAYRGLVTQPLFMDVGMITDTRVAGGLTETTATIALNNFEGDLTTLIDQFAVDGRTVKVRSVRRGASLDTAQTVFEGAIEGFEFQDFNVSLVTRSKGRFLVGPIQTNTFLGTGGLEGGTDLTDKAKPIAMGRSFGVSPPFVGLISGRHTYLVSAAPALPIDTVTAVYDRGILLTNSASFPPGASEWHIDTTTGALTLGSTPAGTITCDINGYAPNGVFLDRSADIIEAILVDFLQRPNTELNGQSFNAMRNVASASVGDWTGTDLTSAAEVISRFLLGASAFGGYNRLGQFTVGVLSTPGGAIRARFDETNIIALRRVLPPAIVNPPRFQHVVGYQQNKTVTTDVAASTSGAQRQFMQAEFREAAAADTSILARHLLTTEFFTPATYSERAAALGEANRLLEVYGNQRRLWQIQTGNISPELDLGATVEVSFAKHNLDKRLGTIVQVSIDLALNQSTLGVFI